jgi:hypothetical protein
VKLQDHGPSAADVERVAAIATATLPLGRMGDDATWQAAIKQVQPRFYWWVDWSANPALQERYQSWIHDTAAAAFYRNVQETERMRQHLLLARRGRQVYEPLENVLRIALDADKDTGVIDAYEIFYDPEWQLRAVAYTSRGEAYLIFRGTQTLRNWMLDLDVRECVPGLHRGFSMAWQRLETQVRQWLEGLPSPPSQLSCSGHSLGGAMAVVAADRLSHQYKIHQVVTFGSPRLAKPQFAENYTKSGLAAKTTRYIHETDLIPRLVPSSMYMHLGQEFFITKGNAISHAAPESTFLRFHRQFADSNAFRAVRGTGTFLKPLVSDSFESDPKGFDAIVYALRPLLYSFWHYVLFAVSAVVVILGAVYLMARFVIRGKALWQDGAEHAMLGYGRAFQETIQKYFPLAAMPPIPWVKLNISKASGHEIRP